MATTGASGSELAIRAILGLLIVALVGVLFYVTVIPARQAAAAERDTNLTRERMGDIRTALISYRDSMSGYPATLDSLVLFTRGDSGFAAQIAVQEERLAEPSIDSLVYSPRDGARFLYEVVTDTTGVEIYWLGDPTQVGDSIGARSVSPALRNAASWE